MKRCSRGKRYACVERASDEVDAHWAALSAPSWASQGRGDSAAAPAVTSASRVSTQAGLVLGVVVLPYAAAPSVPEGRERNSSDPSASQGSTVRRPSYSSARTLCRLHARTYVVLAPAWHCNRGTRRTMRHRRRRLSTMQLRQSRARHRRRGHSGRGRSACCRWWPAIGTTIRHLAREAR